MASATATEPCAGNPCRQTTRTSGRIEYPQELQKARRSLGGQTGAARGLSSTAPSQGPQGFSTAAGGGADLARELGPMVIDMKRPSILAICTMVMMLASSLQTRSSTARPVSG